MAGRGIIDAHGPISGADGHLPRPPNFSRKNAKELVIGNQLQVNVYKKAERLMDYFLKGTQAYTAGLDSRSNFTVYQGYLGLAYMHMMLHLKNNRAESRLAAKNLVDHSLKYVRKRKLSFLQGDAGPLAMAALISLMENDHRQSKVFLHRLKVLGESFLETKQKNTGNEYSVLNGWAGYLYSLLYVNAYVKEAIPKNTVRMYVAKIIDDGYKNARKLRLEVPLAYSSDRTYYGAAHGTAGILYMLLNSGVVTPTELHNLIHPTLNHLISLRFRGGNFPAYSGANDDVVQWCHGAPGFIDLLILSFELFGGPYMQLAEETGNVVWQRGLLRKGYSLCHGISGNAYTFLSLYQKTKDYEQLYRAATYFQCVLDYPNNEGLKPETPFSLFQGQAGILYFLNDMAIPTTATFPCYRLPAYPY